MSNLPQIVKIIKDNIAYFDQYYQSKIFDTYNIGLIDFNNIDGSEINALKLFYFSLTTRQRTSNNPINDNDRENIKNIVLNVLKTLNDVNLGIEQRYFLSLRELNTVRGAGPKIITMYIKFLISHSVNLQDKEKLMKILWIPLDIHLIKFLSQSYYGNHGKLIEPARFRLFDRPINPILFNLSINQDGTPNTNNEYFIVQEIIRKRFIEENIPEPPIILDHLWVIGSARCIHTKFSELISCYGCPFNNGKAICAQERLII